MRRCTVRQVSKRACQGLASPFLGSLMVSSVELLCCFPGGGGIRLVALLFFLIHSLINRTAVAAAAAGMEDFTLYSRIRALLLSRSMGFSNLAEE